jgi:hypothetical protein
LAQFELLKDKCVWQDVYWPSFHLGFSFFSFHFIFRLIFGFFSFHFCAFRFASDRCTLPQQMQNSKNADTLFCLAPLSLLFLCHSLSISLSLFASRYLSLFPNSTDDKNSLYYLPHVLGY